MKIDNLEIGKKCFIVAEIGSNHNGMLSMAKKLIDIAANAKADAVTIQLCEPTLLSTDINIVETIRKLELPFEALREISIYTKKKGMIFGVSVLDEVSLKKALKIKTSFIKTVSGEISNLPLIKAISKTKLPYLMSTGASNCDDINRALDSVGNKKNVILIHTTTKHPTPAEELNLNSIPFMKDTFKLITGYCDHSQVSLAIPMAVAIGADIIEKYIIFDKKLKIADYLVSAEPDEFTQIVNNIRLIETLKGQYSKKLTINDKKIIKKIRKSFHTKFDVAKGTKISDTILVLKRPGGGIYPYSIKTILSKQIQRNLPANYQLNYKDFKKDD